MVRAIPHGTIHGYDLELLAIKAGNRKTTCAQCRAAKYAHGRRSAYIARTLLARFVRTYPELAKEWREELSRQAIKQYPEPGPKE